MESEEPVYREIHSCKFGGILAHRGMVCHGPTMSRVDNTVECRQLSCSHRLPDPSNTHGALAESQNRLQAIFDGVETGIFIIDPEYHRIVDANPIALKMVGLSRADVVGAVCHKFVCPAQMGHCPVTDLGQTVDNSERILLTSNGEKRAIIKTVRPVTISGRPHLLESFLDITERKQAETALKERTNYLNSLIEMSPLGIVVLDAAERVQISNSAFEKLFLYPFAEIQGISLEDLIIPPELAAESAIFTQRCFTEGSLHAATRRRRKDGALLDVEIFAAPVSMDGTTGGLLALYQDVTERKRAEFAMAERHRLATLIAELGVALSAANSMQQGLQKCSEILAAHAGAAFAGVWSVNEQERVLEWQASAGPDAEKDSADAQVPFGSSIIGQIAESGEPYLSNNVLGDRWVEDREWARPEEIIAFVGYPLKVGDRVLGVIAALAHQPLSAAAVQAFASVAHIVAQFIEGKRAEASLRESEDRFRTAFEEAPYGMCMTALDGRFLHANAALCRMLGYSQQELMTGAWQQITHPEDLERSRQVADRFGPGAATTLDLEKRYIHKQGNVIWARLKISAVLDSSGRPSHFITHVDDITERKRAEEALRQSEVRYRELFENATDIVYTTDLQGRFTSLNYSGQKAFACSQEEVNQLTVWQLVAPASLETAQHMRARLFAGGQDIKAEVEIVAKDGRHVLIEVKPRLIYEDGSPIGVQGIARDNTVRHQAEMELRNAQKLESVGRLASGIAHEINTPVQFIGDNVRFLRDAFTSLEAVLGRYSELREASASGLVSPDLMAEVQRVEKETDCSYLLQEIPAALAQTLDGVERVATIVRAMKEFAHPEGKEMAAADLNRALQSTMTVARNELKYVAEIESEFGELPLVVCNISDLNQVFLNLLVNAAHAIADVVKNGEKGRIRVRTAAEGDTVLISISDTGSGIPQAIRGKIYDPFFTTKEVGRGTGQGLAIARSVIVERHKGTLTFDSEIGKGTTFYIRLPLAPEKQARS